MAHQQTTESAAPISQPSNTSRQLGVRTFPTNAGDIADIGGLEPVGSLQWPKRVSQHPSCFQNFMTSFNNRTWWERGKMFRLFLVCYVLSNYVVDVELPDV